jgi:hypothetical protein
MLTRSMMQIMVLLASEIEVPPEHVAEGRTVPSLAKSHESFGKMTQLIDIHCTNEKPEKAFVSVKYDGHWFWIDRGDFYSKRVFAFLMILFSLTETGGKEGLPLVTIPAN